MEQANKAKIITVAGTKETGKKFMASVINEILKLSGYKVMVLNHEQTVNDNKWFEQDVDFIIVVLSIYDIAIDGRSDLIFTSKRNLLDTISVSHTTDELVFKLQEANSLINWIRSPRHAYNQNYDVAMNRKQLNNGPNLNAIMSAMRFFFKGYTFDVEPIVLMQALDKINPRNERTGANLFKEEREQKPE